MTRLSPIKLYLANRRGDFPSQAIGYLDKEVARQRLQSLTGQDFGLDVEKWQEWIKANPQKPPQILKLPRVIKDIQARAQHRQKMEACSETNWGEAICVQCGQRLRVWADSMHKRCGYCHFSLPPH